jgi:hypothetical protein
VLYRGFAWHTFARLLRGRRHDPNPPFPPLAPITSRRRRPRALSFVNTDPGHTHKDIKIVTSDGASPKSVDASPVGCDSDFRFWEGRDDFSVSKMSALRVRYARGTVSAYIDAQNNGNWKECFSNVVVPGMESWYKDGAWLGLTATTGDLADNHDVSSMITVVEDEAAPDPKDETPRPEIISSGNDETDKAIRSAAAFETHLLVERLAALEQRFEYECVPPAVSCVVVILV